MQYKEYDPKILKKLQGVQLEILEAFIKICEKYELDYFMLGGTAIGVVRHQGFIPWDDDIDVAMPRKDYNKFLEVVNKEIGDKYKILTPLLDQDYACNVTHLQKKGTKFVPYSSVNLQSDLCIDIDVFPLDHVPDNPRMRNRQLKKTWALNKLIYLCGTSDPLIPLEGKKKKLAKIICVVIHIILKSLNVSPASLYRILIREATRYNSIPTKYINAFEVTMSRQAYISKKEMFPLRKMPFEHLEVKMPNDYDTYLKRLFGNYMQIPPKDKRVNHCPYILDFGDENDSER